MSRKNSYQPCNSALRKDFYKRLFYIALCIVPVYFFADNKDAYRFISLFFFLIGMYQLITIIRLSRQIIDDFFPPEHIIEKTTTLFNRYIYYGAAILFFASLIFLIAEIKKISFTVHGLKLFWTAGATGLMLAIICTIVLKTVSPSVYFQSERRYTVHFSLFAGLFFITAASASFINHFYSAEASTCKAHLLVRKEISGGRSVTYYLYIKLDDESIERFSTNRERYERFKEGGLVKFCIAKGKLGYDYVTGIEEINQP